MFPCSLFERCRESGIQDCSSRIEQWLLTSERILTAGSFTVGLCVNHTYMLHRILWQHSRSSGAVLHKKAYELCVKFEETGRKPPAHPHTTPRLMWALEDRTLGGGLMVHMCSFTFLCNHRNILCVCACVCVPDSSSVGSYNFYRLQPELGGNGRANMLTTVQIHVRTDTHQFLSCTLASVLIVINCSEKRDWTLGQWKDKFMIVLLVKIQQLYCCTYLALSLFKCTVVLIKSFIDFIDLSALKLSVWAVF